MKERSTHAVVGLCGNESTMTRGLGHDSSNACMSPSKNASPGSEHVVVRHVGALQRHLAHVGAGEERPPDVDRVGRRRHQRGVARADQHPHEVREALLGADGRHHLGLGVELDVELALVEVGDGAAQLGDPPRRRVAVVARVVGGLGQLAHRHVGRGQVGVAEAEVDHVPAGSPRRRLEVVDRGEDVGRQPVDPAELHRSSLRPACPPGRTVGPGRARAPGRRDQRLDSRPASRRPPSWHPAARRRAPFDQAGASAGGGPAQVTSSPSGAAARSATTRRVGVPHVDGGAGRPRLFGAGRRTSGHPHGDPGLYELGARA